MCAKICVFDTENSAFGTKKSAFGTKKRNNIPSDIEPLKIRNCDFFNLVPKTDKIETVVKVSDETERRAECISTVSEITCKVITTVIGSWMDGLTFATLEYVVMKYNSLYAKTLGKLTIEEVTSILRNNSYFFEWGEKDGIVCFKWAYPKRKWKASTGNGN